MAIWTGKNITTEPGTELHAGSRQLITSFNFMFVMQHAKTGNSCHLTFATNPLQVILLENICFLCN